MRNIQQRSQPQDRHLRSKTLPGAPGGSILRPRMKGFSSRGPRNLRSGGALPQISGALYVGRRCRVGLPPDARLKEVPGVSRRPGASWSLRALARVRRQVTGIPKCLFGQMVFWRPGVPRPNNHTFSGTTTCFFGLTAFGGKATNHYFS